MESLPTELLVRILGLAAATSLPYTIWSDDPTLLLLDTVPLVCRRWQAVARDPACWAGVEVHGGQRLFHGVWLRLLARAPALRAVSLLCRDSYPSFRAHMKRLERALLASEAVVLDSLTVTADVRKALSDRALLPLFQRSQKHLRSLQVHLRPSGDHQLLQAVSALSRLVKLHFWVVSTEENGEDIAYSGELAAMVTTRLRDLSVCVVRELDFDDDSLEDLEMLVGSAYPAALVEDALRCGAATLEAVALDGQWQLPRSTLRLLDQCPALARLTASPSCLGAGAAMDAVRELELEVIADDDEVYDDDVDEGELPAKAIRALRRIRAALQQCGHMPMHCLKALTVKLVLCFPDEYGLAAKCGKLTNKFAAIRPDVEVELVIDDYRAW